MRTPPTKSKLPMSCQLARRVRDLVKVPGIPLADGSGWAVKPTPFSDPECAILEELAWHWNEESGLSWPSVKTIADRIGRSERHVQRLLRDLEGTRDLEGVGIIECPPNEGKGGRKGEVGITRPYALHILDWPYTKLGCHSYVTVEADPRVTSDAARVTSDAPKGDISARLGWHLDVTQTYGTSNENQKREPSLPPNTLALGTRARVRENTSTTHAAARATEVERIALLGGEGEKKKANGKDWRNDPGWAEDIEESRWATALYNERLRLRRQAEKSGVPLNREEWHSPPRLRRWQQQREQQQRVGGA